MLRILSDTIWLIAVAVTVLFLMLVATTEALAETARNPVADCEAAKMQAAAEFGVSPNLLVADSRTAAGDPVLGNWPWTVTQQGRRIWFDSRDEAQLSVFRNLRKGRKEIDIGCFQLNYAVYGGRFDTIEDMFEPRQNARLAVRVLRDLAGELGGWDRARGAYMSRTAHWRLTRASSQPETPAPPKQPPMAGPIASHGLKSLRRGPAPLVPLGLVTPGAPRNLPDRG